MRVRQREGLVDACAAACAGDGDGDGDDAVRMLWYSSVSTVGYMRML